CARSFYYDYPYAMDYW
nr:immunoglobulin heavy chain junction region [Mus musculus]MBK4195658.1 immunoglobulin heavy chain junction region [Mus musculus]